MDRFDERKPDATTDDVNEQPRQGDILGLSGAEVPKAPNDPSTEYDAESVAQRRDRARAGDVLGLAHESEDLTRGAGATGIDMGGGGTGTDVTEE
jgi:hypothetical protein